MRASPFAAGGERGVVRCRQRSVTGDMQIFMVGFSTGPRLHWGILCSGRRRPERVPRAAPGR